MGVGLYQPHHFVHHNDRGVSLFTYQTFINCQLWGHKKEVIKMYTYFVLTLFQLHNFITLSTMRTGVGLYQHPTEVIIRMWPPSSPPPNQEKQGMSNDYWSVSISELQGFDLQVQTKKHLKYTKRHYRVCPSLTVMFCNVQQVTTSGRGDYHGWGGLYYNSLIAGVCSIWNDLRPFAIHM